METFAHYLAGIDDPEHRARLEQVLKWVMERFPNLEPRVAWNQPMLTDHGTFIIGFSVAKNHFAVAPEKAALLCFADEVIAAGYEHGKMLIRIKWTDRVDYDLLERIIAFNIADKADCKTFWRKES